MQYVPISIDVLVEGMTIDYSIFYKLDGEFVLACKDVELTEEVMLRLQNLATYNIYVPENLKTKILSESALIRGVQELVELQVDFKKIKESTKTMLDSISLDEKVPNDLCNTIAEELQVKLETVDNSLIIQCINGIRNADEYLYNHSMNVALLNGLMGRWLNFSEQEIEKLVKVGLIHDIGKVKIPEEILQKPGKLTSEEFAQIKQHPVYSYEFLINSGVDDEKILNGAMQHHEKVNGRGYPYGIGADNISEFAKITAVSDVYDAMVAKRVYKEPHSPFEILSSFSEDRYSELDINYINVFLRRMPEELTDKLVLLSDGSVGRVAFVNASDYEHPLIEVDGKVIKTDENLKCVSMYLGKKGEI